jgi:hypothetical protein
MASKLGADDQKDCKWAVQAVYKAHLVVDGQTPPSQLPLTFRNGCTLISSYITCSWSSFSSFEQDLAQQRGTVY